MTAPVRPGGPGAPRFLSEADCHDIAQRLARYAIGGGYTTATLLSQCNRHVRWARNQVSTSGEIRSDHVIVNRNIRGAMNQWVMVNETTDAALVAALRRAERLLQFRNEVPPEAAEQHTLPDTPEKPAIFHATTYDVDAAVLAAAARQSAQPAVAAGVLSAGYIETTSCSQALVASDGYSRFCQYTWAQHSMTARDATGTGSGWAGVDWDDWSKIDSAGLSAIAVEKCLQSRNPVAVEPGRYTTILEPQAVCDFAGRLFYELGGASYPGVQGVHRLDRKYNFIMKDAPFNVVPGDGKGNSTEEWVAHGETMLGRKVMDERITIRSDLLDPDLGFLPFKPIANMFNTFTLDTEFYHPVTWVEHGVLTHLGGDIVPGPDGRPRELPIQGAFKMSGGETSVAEMIATTVRGLLVTRFDQVRVLDNRSMLCRGITRDGVWLIEHGKISKPVKNMVFTESILFALNHVEQLGVPQRAFHPSAGLFLHNMPQPVIAPSLKVTDFSFTQLDDAV